MDVLPTDRRFTVLNKTHLVALDQRFIRAAATWPQLLIAIHRRLNDQEHRVATHGVICQLPRVEQRLLAILWHLAGRIGTVTPSGTEIPLRITHEQLGRLVGAQRPTVSLALRELSDRGRVLRRPDGVWVLSGDTEPDDIVLGGGAGGRQDR
jgi:CRP/FNR family transcriptional regulator, cyclic AMP receptor protein